MKAKKHNRFQPVKDLTQSVKCTLIQTGNSPGLLIIPAQIDQTKEQCIMLRDLGAENSSGTMLLSYNAAIKLEAAICSWIEQVNNPSTVEWTKADNAGSGEISLAT